MLRCEYVNSTELDWTSDEALEKDLAVRARAVREAGKGLVITVAPIHWYTGKDGRIYTNGSFKIVTLADKVRIQYADGSTKTIKNRLAA
jgi:hypothetical protein